MNLEKGLVPNFFLMYWARDLHTCSLDGVCAFSSSAGALKLSNAGARTRVCFGSSLILPSKTPRSSRQLRNALEAPDCQEEACPVAVAALRLLRCVFEIYGASRAGAPSAVRIKQFSWIVFS